MVTSIIISIPDIPSPFSIGQASLPQQWLALCGISRPSEPTTRCGHRFYGPGQRAGSATRIQHRGFRPQTSHSLSEGSGSDFTPGTQWTVMADQGSLKFDENPSIDLFKEPGGNFGLKTGTDFTRRGSRRR